MRIVLQYYDAVEAPLRRGLFALSATKPAQRGRRKAANTDPLAKPGSNKDDDR